MPEEDEDDDRDHDHLLGQLVLHRGDRAVDQLGAVVGRDHLDARGQRRLELLQLCLDARDDVERVLPIAHDDDAADHVALPVQVRDAAPQLRAQGHRPDIPDGNRGAVHRLEHGALEILDRFHISAAADHVFAAGELDEPSAHVVVALAHGINHGVEHQSIGRQRGRIDVDLVLAHLPADGGNFGHAGHRLQRIAKKPVLI